MTKKKSRFDDPNLNLNGTLSPVETVETEREVYENIVRHSDELVAYAKQVRKWATTDGLDVHRANVQLDVNSEFIRSHLNAIEKLHQFRMTYYF